mmetsp:Transcript_15344/g.41491  ORF Transcript_15344/g.41491 Transcript_15344/m.41491 type:complete len:263 (-) Transcript_15344:65-853(-)
MLWTWLTHMRWCSLVFACSRFSATMISSALRLSCRRCCLFSASSCEMRLRAASAARLSAADSCACCRALRSFTAVRSARRRRRASCSVFMALSSACTDAALDALRWRSRSAPREPSTSTTCRLNMDTCACVLLMRASWLSLMLPSMPATCERSSATSASLLPISASSSARRSFRALLASFARCSSACSSWMMPSCSLMDAHRVAMRLSSALRTNSNSSCCFCTAASSAALSASSAVFSAAAAASSAAIIASALPSRLYGRDS